MKDINDNTEFVVPQQKKSPDELLEISVVDIVRFVQKYKILLIVTPVIAGIIGVLYSFTLPKLYISKTVLLPEYSMSSGSSFFSLSMGSSQGAENLVPDLYPEILKSNPFGIYLLNQPIVDKNNKAYKSLREYLRATTTQGMMSNFFSFGKKDAKSETISTVPELLEKKDILSISRQESNQVRTALALINTTVEKKKAVITIESESKDPVVSALIVQAGKEYLMKYVEDYRTYKASRQVDFLEERFREAKRRQQSSEFALQSYRDRNRSAFTNVARIEEMRLQSDYSLAVSLFSSLTSQLEQARIKLKEEKPVFKVLEPANIPLDKSSPKRFTLGVIGAFIGIGVILLYLLIFKEKVYRAFL